jgi:predicted ATPase
MGPVDTFSAVIVGEIHAANYRSLRSIRFPTSRLTVFVGANGVGKTNLYRALQLPRRVFEAQELSDGTLRYLALAGALLSLRLPSFIALNEPESSLHPDLLQPLARMIAKASERTQIWLVTHSERLAAALEKHGGVPPRTVIKQDGKTWIEGLKQIGRFEEEDED